MASEKESLSSNLERYTGGSHLGSNPEWFESDAAWKAEQVANLLRTYSVVPTSICDVGCGTGGVLERLAYLYPEARLSGFEVAPAALELAGPDRVARLGLQLGDARASGDRIDLLLLMDVIEHVEDYFGLLRGLRGNAEWIVLHIPLALSAQTVVRLTPLMSSRTSVGHIHYFTRQMALAALEECGYEIVADRFTLGGLDREFARTWRTRVARFPRKFAFRINADVASRTFGGSSLLVLTRTGT